VPPADRAPEARRTLRVRSGQPRPRWSRSAMEFRILGPLEVASYDDVQEVHGAKTRALLALFLVHANQVVAPDRLIDDLWEGAPPNSATPTLQTYVSQLRTSVPLSSVPK